MCPEITIKLFSHYTDEKIIQCRRESLELSLDSPLYFQIDPTVLIIFEDFTKMFYDSTIRLD